MKTENLISNTLLCVQPKGTRGWEVPSCTGRTKGQRGQQWRTEPLDACPCTLRGNVMTSDNWGKIAQEENSRSANRAQTSSSSLLYSNNPTSEGGGYTRCWTWKIVWPSPVSTQMVKLGVASVQSHYSLGNLCILQPKLPYQEIPQGVSTTTGVLSGSSEAK